MSAAMLFFSDRNLFKGDVILLLRDNCSEGNGMYLFGLLQGKEIVSGRGLVSLLGWRLAGNSGKKEIEPSSYGSRWQRGLIRDEGKRECLVDVKKAQGMGIFRLESLLEKAQGVTITDCHAGNPCVHICDPRVENYSPMIESLYGRDG
ncbi:hypothetical protein Tco_1018354 [Tanacetum coccineum]|uniref:Uncharacterized protein n=1 Tax=Tanacetum coccineum TaxID=301880 RepID=A0ABQ5FV66_9ASTR